PDEVYASVRDHFSEEELVDLTIAVIATNGFNRLNIAFRPEVGDYRPGMFDQPKTEQAVILAKSGCLSFKLGHHPKVALRLALCPAYAECHVRRSTHHDNSGPSSIPKVNGCNFGALAFLCLIRKAPRREKSPSPQDLRRFSRRAIFPNAVRARSGFAGRI